MQNKNGSIILSKFLSNEIAAIYKKYSNISDDVANMIGVFIDKIERYQIDYDPYLDYNTTKALAEEKKVDLVRLYVFLTSDLNIELKLEEVKEMYYKLVDHGYIEIDEHLIYYDYSEEELEKMAEEKLVDDLEDA